MSSTLSRRSFMRQSMGAAVTAGLAQVPAPSAKGQEAESGGSGGIRLGAPAFAGTEDPEELARWHRAAGYRAAYCPQVSLDDSDRIRAVEKAFARHDVLIAEVGRWVNLLDADPGQRKKNLATVTEGLALADAVGARCCVDIAGSYNSEFWYGPHPDNFSPTFFDAAVENARSILDAVNPRRAKFCYEMMGWAIPEHADRYLDLIQAVDRPGFAVHLDPCNLVNSPEKFYRNTDVINECFDKLGRWIVSCHAKDLTWDVEMNLHFREVIPGTGSLDYATYLRRLAEMPDSPPLMIEHLSGADEYAQAARFIVETATRLGLRIDQ